MRRPIQLFALLCLTAVCATPVANGQTRPPYPEPSFRWHCTTGDTLLNFNPAVRAGEGLPVFDSLPYAGDYTVIVVYNPVADTEAVLWRLTFGDSASRGLTTERILSDSLSIRYAEYTDGRPVISTLRQTAPDSTAPYVRMTVGGSGVPAVAEVLYFTERLGNAALRKVQGYLAVRYGVTLGPVAYLDAQGRHVWDYTDSGLYHHRVTGVGVDTFSGLCQLRSRSEEDGAVLTISIDSMENGSYLIVGDDDAPMAFGQKGDIEMLERTWRVQSTRTEGRAFTLAFCTRGWALPGDSLALMTGDTVYLQSYRTVDSAVFAGVVFPAGVGLFTLGRGGSLWQRTQPAAGKGVARDGGTDTGVRFSARVYPNPTKGDYTVEVRGAGWVRVAVHNTLGQEVAVFEDSGRTEYTFRGTLPLDNVYYATIVTERGSQTTKLVTKQ